MKVETADRQVIKSGEFREKHFALAQNAHIFKILRDGIYSDKPLAVIREYWANARDEHMKKGRADLPVDITLPSYIEPYLKIRDYGIGLTRKEVEDIYIIYGESTKTGSNDFIGALGIGSKSAFCYTSAFQVTSFMGGKASVYSCYIDETEMGKIAHVDTTATDEPDGVEISIPINTSDFDLFKIKIQQLFLYAKQRPNIKGDMYFKFQEPEYVLEGKFWSVLTESDNASFCTMGDVPYAFDKNAFISTYSSIVASLRKQEQVNQEVLVEEGKLDKVNVDAVITYPTDLPNAIRKLLEFNVLLRFDIGQIEMAASREALSYKTKTIIGIYDKLKVMLDEIKEKVRIDADACTTLWDVKKLWANYYLKGAEGAGTILRRLDLLSFRWNNIHVEDSEIEWGKAKIPLPVVIRPAPVDAQGKPITDPVVLAAITPPPPPEPIECILYKRKSNMKLDKIMSSIIEATTGQVRVIINDTNTSRGIFTSMNALTPRSYESNYNYVFSCINKENTDSLIKFFTDNGVPIEYLSKIDIPKADRAAARTGSPKYSKKFFVFNAASYAGKDSDYWDIADVDPEEEEGIYVIIDRYIPQFTGSSGISSLQTLIKFIESVENKPLTVYGIKVAASTDLGTNWTKLEKYCNEVGARVMNDINYDQVLADYTHLETFNKEKHVLEMFLGIYKWGSSYLPATAKIHDMHKPIRVVIDNHKKYREKEGLADMMRIIGHHSDTVARPTCDLSNVLTNEFLHEYPMIRYSTSAYKNFPSSDEKKAFLQEAATYIRTIELSR